MFKDHFSSHAGSYARYRPVYPEALYTYLAGCCEAHEVAWDCATGNGQAALGLTPYFEQVVATDASAGQIEHATPHERVVYHVAPAEASPLADTSVDLITVAQALHWFDFDAFFTEVRRVLKPRGVLAVWAYGMLNATPAVNPLVEHYYREIVGPYWPPERRFLDDGLQTILFPFEQEPTPAIDMTMMWTQEELLGYLGTWSATHRYRHAHGTEPLELIRPALETAWGDAHLKFIQWPLYVRIGRHQ